MVLFHSINFAFDLKVELHPHSLAFVLLDHHSFLFSLLLLCLDALKMRAMEKKVENLMGSGHNDNNNSTVSFRDVEVLVDHYDEIIPSDLADYRKGVKIMREAFPTSADICKYNDDYLTDDTKMFQLFSKLESNGFGLWKADVLMGRAVYPLASFFNHFCDPNCYTKQEHRSISIFTSCDVVLGTELCISYIDFNQPRSSRQRSLMEDYHFACVCQRCESEKSLPPHSVKIKYNKSVNNTLKGKAGEKKRREKKEKKAKEKRERNDDLTEQKQGNEDVIQLSSQMQSLLNEIKP